MNFDSKRRSDGGNPQEEQLLLNTLSKNGSSVMVSPSKTISSSGKDFEKPLLSPEPVRLTPAWEENNLPNDELNLRGVTMDNAELEANPPRDRWKLVYLTLMLHGIGTLMPWNMIITAKSYFVDYKLAESYTHVNSTYGTYFLPTIGIASQAPNILFNWLNIFINLGGNFTSRVVWSILIEVIAFLFTVLLVMVDTSAWPGIFFALTVATVVILNMANGIYQNTVYGMAAKLPLQYTGAVVLGSNVSGTFTTIISILSQVFAPSARTAAIYYFITALFILLACFDTYFALPFNRFYRYHELIHEKKQKMKKSVDVHSKTPYWKIFKQTSPQLFNVFFIFFVTLAIFPAVHADIKLYDTANFIIPADYYMSVLCFLTFNVTAMIGSWLSTFFAWPGKRTLVIPVILRALFIPLFLFCNYQPKDLTRVLPVLITNDYAHWVIGASMGVSSGYLSSLAMMYCPRMVEPQYASVAGMFGAACLITGVGAGVLFSFVMPWIVSNVSFNGWL